MRLQYLRASFQATIYPYQSMSWNLKKWVFGSGGWTKHNIDCQYIQGVYFLEKYDELSKLVVFGQKMYFMDQNRPKGNHMEMNFEYF